MLGKFNEAFQSFERDAYAKIRKHHFDAGLDSRSVMVKWHAEALTDDIGYFSMTMKELYEAALNDVSNEMDQDVADYDAYRKAKSIETDGKLVLDEEFHKNMPRRTPCISIPMAKFGAAFEAFFFIIRAYQDAIYKVSLCAGGLAVGPKASMNNAVDVLTKTFVSTNPVGKLLRETVPEYAEWFASFRSRRNFIKYGAAVSYQGGKNFITNETNISIRLAKTMYSSDESTISLDDVSNALSLSAKATKAIVDAGLILGKLK